MIRVKKKKEVKKRSVVVVVRGLETTSETPRTNVRYRTLPRNRMMLSEPVDYLRARHGRGAVNLYAEEAKVIEEGYHRLLSPMVLANRQMGNLVRTLSLRGNTISFWGSRGREARRGSATRHQMSILAAWRCLVISRMEPGMIRFDGSINATGFQGLLPSRLLQDAVQCRPGPQKNFEPRRGLSCSTINVNPEALCSNCR